MSERAKSWTPRDREWAGNVMVVLPRPICSEALIFAIGGGSSKEAGTHPGKSNQHGAISVTVDDGGQLGVRPYELTEWWYQDTPERVFVWDDGKRKWKTKEQS